MNKNAKLLFMASGLLSFATGLLIILKFIGDSDISYTYLGLGLVGAALFLIAGLQFNKADKNK